MTFTDSGGHTVTVAASSGVAVLTGFGDGPVSSVLNVTDSAGNMASASGVSILLQDDDTLVGGTGADVFAIGAGDGNDTVTDFENGVDKINAGTLATSFAGVTVTQDGSDVVIGFGSGSPTLRLQNTAVASVNASDFMFGEAAEITGDVTGSVTEKGGVANGTAGVATASGDLDATRRRQRGDVRGAEQRCQDLRHVLDRCAGRLDLHAGRQQCRRCRR